MATDVVAGQLPERRPLVRTVISPRYGSRRSTESCYTQLLSPGSTALRDVLTWWGSALLMTGRHLDTGYLVIQNNRILTINLVREAEYFGMVVKGKIEQRNVKTGGQAPPASRQVTSWEYSPLLHNSRSSQVCHQDCRGGLLPWQRSVLLQSQARRRSKALRRG